MPNPNPVSPTFDELLHHYRHYARAVVHNVLAPFGRTGAVDSNEVESRAQEAIRRLHALQGLTANGSIRDERAFLVGIAENVANSYLRKVCQTIEYQRQRIEPTSRLEAQAIEPADQHDYFAALERWEENEVVTQETLERVGPKLADFWRYYIAMPEHPRQARAQALNAGLLQFNIRRNTWDTRLDRLRAEFRATAAARAEKQLNYSRILAFSRSPTPDQLRTVEREAPARLKPHTRLMLATVLAREGTPRGPGGGPPGTARDLLGAARAQAQRSLHLARRLRRTDLRGMAVYRLATVDSVEAIWRGTRSGQEPDSQFEQAGRLLHAAGAGDLYHGWCGQRAVLFEQLGWDRLANDLRRLGNKYWQPDQHRPGKLLYQLMSQLHCLPLLARHLLGRR